MINQNEFDPGGGSFESGDSAGGGGGGSESSEDDQRALPPNAPDPSEFSLSEIGTGIPTGPAASTRSTVTDTMVTDETNQGGGMMSLSDIADRVTGPPGAVERAAGDAAFAIGEASGAVADAAKEKVVDPVAEAEGDVKSAPFDFAADVTGSERLERLGETVDRVSAGLVRGVGSGLSDVTLGIGREVVTVGNLAAEGGEFTASEVEEKGVVEGGISSAYAAKNFGEATGRALAEQAQENPAEFSGSVIGGLIGGGAVARSTRAIRQADGVPSVPGSSRLPDRDRGFLGDDRAQLDLVSMGRRSDADDTIELSEDTLARRDPEPPADLDQRTDYTDREIATRDRGRREGGGMTDAERFDASSPSTLMERRAAKRRGARDVDQATPEADARAVDALDRSTPATDFREITTTPGGASAESTAAAGVISGSLDRLDAAEARLAQQEDSLDAAGALADQPNGTGRTVTDTDTRTDTRDLADTAQDSNVLERVDVDDMLRDRGRTRTQTRGRGDTRTRTDSQTRQRTDITTRTDTQTDTRTRTTPDTDTGPPPTATGPGPTDGDTSPPRSPRFDLNLGEGDDKDELRRVLTEDEVFGSGIQDPADVLKNL